MKVFRAYLSLFALAVCAGGVQAQTFELEGREVAVYNLAGNIRIEPGTGSSVVVQVTRAGRDAQRLGFQADRIDGKHTLRVIFPGDDIVVEGLPRGSNTNLRVNDDGTFNRGRDGRRVSIRTGAGDREALHARADLVVRVPQGVRVDARLGVGEINARDVASELDLETSVGDITVTGTRGALEVESASGGITVQNTQGDLDLESASGGIDITNANAQTIEVEVASGSIRVQGARAETIELETASGSITVTGTSAPELEAESASGSVRVELDGDVRAVEVNTASGAAEIALPANFAGDVEISTASGGIDVDFPINVTQQRRNHLRGTIGSGGSGRVEVSTASGSVRLRRR